MKKVNLENLFDNDNPAVIVNNFFLNHPNFETAKDNINFELINFILSKTINNFNITKEEFDVLLNIKAIRLALPIENKDDLVKVVGKYLRYNSTGVAGAYVFTNKPLENKYVGSSISLANRLNTSYLGPKLGNRKIDLAIKEIGLKNFVLDIYLLPSVYYSATNKEKLRNLTLALEQILILLYNPSYNVLKIAGSISGFKHSDESIQNNKIRNSKAFYIYDELSKELIYVSDSQRDMAKILRISDTNFYKYKDKQVKYLGQFIFSGTPLNSEEYSENILDAETLKKIG